MMSCLFYRQAYSQIASWNYEPIQGALSSPVSNTGSGTSSVVNFGGGTITPGGRTGMAGTGCGTQNGVTAWALEPFDPGNANETNGAQFNCGTTGYQNISFNWDQRWSNTCPNTVRLQYTLDGSAWNNFVMTSGNTTFCLGSLNANGCFEVNTSGDIFTRLSADLSSIAGANNNPNFGVRLLASYYQSTGQFRQTSTPSAIAGILGTWRFDNVAFTGTLMPGPTASVISGTTGICPGGTANIKVTITAGTGPFTLIYSDGSTTFTVNNYLSGSNIPVSPASTKTYTIVSVTNANGVAGTGNSGSATITINALPAIPTSSNTTTCAAGPVALPAGSPAGGTYSIPNPYSGASTTFTYTVTNGSGCSRTSATYTFTRNTPPTIVTQPSVAGQTVCQNAPFSPLGVTASGTATLSYQWYRNTVQSTTGGTPLTGAAFAAEIANGSKTANFTPLSNVAGTYYYYVTITNSCTSVKSIATGAFTVLPLSVSGTVSAAQTICAGNLPADLTLAGYSGSVVKWQKADDIGFTANVQDIAVTSATLQGSSVGPVTQTQYIRAIIQNGSCPAAVTAPIQLLVKSTTWTGTWSNGVPDSVTAAIFNADYSSAGNLNACSAIVNSGNVIFNPGHTLTLQNGLTVSGGTMTFENTAALVQISNAPNSGNITYKRDSTGMKAYDYTYWSSPVDFQILSSFSPLTRFDKYFWFDPVLYIWSSVTAPGITPMEVGKGYIIRAPADFDMVTPTVFHGEFIGVPNNGDYPVNITVSGLGNLNLLGNPYPSAIDADLFMSDPSNATAIGTGTTIYLWTHNTPITGQQYIFADYATYNYTGGTGTSAAAGTNTSIPNGSIAAGQAFMIKGLASGTAIFKNTMRLTGNNNQFFRNTNLPDSEILEKHRIWLELKNTAGAYKQALIGYLGNATDGLDPGYDSEILEAGNPVSFYSILGTSKLAIQGKALPFSTSDSVTLGYHATDAGTYSIALSNFDGLFADQDIFLEDLDLNIIHNLKQSAYEFNTEPGTFETRFVLRFTDSALSVENFGDAAASINVANHNHTINIAAGNMIIDDVEVFDIAGRIIAEKRQVNASSASIGGGNVNGILLIRIRTSDGKIFNRKIIN